MKSHNTSLSDLISNPDHALKCAREAGVATQTELGPMLVRHAAVRAAAQNPTLRPAFPETLARLGIRSGPFYDWIKSSPLNMEGDEHRAWRQLMLRTFTPRSVDRLRPFLAREAHALIDRVAPAGECDFVHSFARHFPAAALCELMGVPPEDRARFSSWADNLGYGFNFALLREKIVEVDAAMVQLLAYAGELAAQRRAEPRDDLVTRIAQAADEMKDIGEADIRGWLAGLVFVGYETTKNQLGWMMTVMCDAPDEWDRVAREPDRARDVIEEVLRFRSTATALRRVATQDVELFGEHFPAGSLVLASLWSANRDPAVFRQPDAFAVDENRGGVQLAFGQGAHHCLGAALARAELQESLVALTSRMHCPKLGPGAQYLPPFGVNGPTSLPISFELR